eukprot:CAMPEP_0174708576 /NCGR_PEP_ID=MMETSP1094-20130205/10790_1 /TAXON_ID=156173 /ORGANISM="Chrysochromulina brevifilum, Strain UTEX LB 985" /LENGTH=105 /DNA_ID=CAMNT_0015907151 /DNA_START=275 /DNA_END=588 /DNA_ORIENTATION=+
MDYALVLIIGDWSDVRVVSGCWLNGAAHCYAVSQFRRARHRASQIVGKSDVLVVAVLVAMIVLVTVIMLVTVVMLVIIMVAMLVAVVLVIITVARLILLRVAIRV